MRRLLGLSTLLALFAAGPALAAPKEKSKEKKEETEESADEPLPNPDDFKESGDEDEAATAPSRVEDGDKEEDEPEDLDFTDDKTDEIQFKDEDEQESVKPRGPGEDSAQIYRDTQKKLAEATADEELIAWEAYLKKYPKSLFRERVENRMEELSAELFGERVPGSDRGARREDAANRELNFTSPLQFGSAEPRNRIGGTAEIGIPNWFAPNLDAELQVLRDLSIHAGIDRGVTGTGFLLGGKYALIKSARTNTVLSGALDFDLTLSPTFPTLEPRIMAGQKLPVLEGLYLQASLGVDAELRSPVGMRYVYGFNAELRPNDVVYAFVETTGELKFLGADAFDPFKFMVLSFGMKFVPTKGGLSTVLAEKDGFFVSHAKKPVVLVLGANFPYASRYWGFYQGSVTLGAQWYL